MVWIASPLQKVRFGEEVLRLALRAAQDEGMGDVVRLIAYGLAPV